MAPIIPTIRLNLQAPFPALVQGSGALVISKLLGVWTLAIDFTKLQIQAPAPGAYPTDYVLVYDAVAKIQVAVALSTIVAAAAGAARTQRSVVASPIVIAGGDQILNVNIAAGAPICALPASATRAGVPLTFKDVGGNFGAHGLLITPNGIETIDGQPNLLLNVPRQGVTLVPFNDGTNTGWAIE